MKAQITPSNKKAFSVLWGSVDETLITGHEDGAIIKWDLRTSKKVVLIVIFFLYYSNEEQVF